MDVRDHLLKSDVESLVRKHLWQRARYKVSATFLYTLNVWTGLWGVSDSPVGRLLVQ